MEQVGRVLNLNTLVKNSGVSYVSTIALVGLGSLTKVLLARSLSPRELGLLLTGQALVALAAALAQLSIPEALVRFIGYSSGPTMQREAGLVRSALWTALAASIVILFVSFAGARVIANSLYHQPELTAVLVVLAFALPLGTTAMVLTSSYQGLGRMWEKILYIDLVPGVFVVASLAVLKGLGRGSLLNVTCLYVAAAAISAGLAIHRFRTDRAWRVTTSVAVPVRDLLRFSLPLLAAGLVAWPMAFIPLMLGVRDVSGVAYYNLAVALASLIYAPVGAAESVALPVWSSQIVRGQNRELRSDYAFTTSWCLIFGSVIFALLMFCPAEIIKVMYGKQYLAGVSTLRWIAPVFLLNAATGPNESLLKALGATKWIFVSRLCAGAGVIVATVIWRTQGGLNRAIWSFWVSALIGIIMYSSYLFVRNRIHPVTAAYFKSWSAILCSLAVVAISGRWLHVNSGFVTILVTGGLYLFTLFLCLMTTGYGSSEDAAKLRALYHGALLRYSVRTASTGTV